MPKVTAISISTPAAATTNPSATPELLASILARYSRSNDGLDSIFAKVDKNNCEASVDRILKFADYGHASIGGLTGGIAVAIDDVSMYLAYRLFEFSQMADGQESSTRYITLDENGLPDPIALGFSKELAPKVKAVWLQGLNLYNIAYKALDAAALANPEIVRYPENAKPAVIERIKKNYALDRARYLLPFAMSTNVALVQSARMWAETLSGLYCLAEAGQKEAGDLANALKVELTKYAPRLIKHGRVKPAWLRSLKEELEAGAHFRTGVDTDLRPAKVKVLNLEDDPALDAKLSADIHGRENRYDHCGHIARTTAIGVSFPELPIAELRDLNRHRTGGRFSPLDQKFFYLPDETAELDELKYVLADFFTALEELNTITPTHLKPYIRFLGSVTSFTHTTTLDKFVYTAELRTGLGAHFVYADAYRNAVSALAANYPLTAAEIQLGTAEPE